MKNNKKSQEDMIKSIAVVGAVTLVVLLMVLISIQFLKNKIADGNIRQEEVISEKEVMQDFESASTEIGKTVEDAQKDIEDDKKDNNENNTAKKSDEKVQKEELNGKSKIAVSKEQNKETTKIEDEKKEEKKPENEQVIFQAPIKGEIIRDFASDTLVYSDTLQEWITHNGLDIKADKTSVVVSACDGTVEAIKSDPRYGLTVIINHENGYKTVYSNLLTAEFVAQGENVKAGQTIGTVGNSASFEVSDAYHLHFELLKDGEYQNPTIFIEF